MIAYNDIYNITAGIYTCFNAKKTQTKKVLKVNHSSKKREELRKFFSNAVSDFSLNDLVFRNLYINMIEPQSSLTSTILKLNQIDELKIKVFKDKIKYYYKYIIDDLEKIKNQNTHLNLDIMVKYYRENEINWFTFYYYLEHSKDSKKNKDKIRKSRIDSRLLRKIETLLLYLNLPNKSAIVEETLKTLENNIESY